MSLMITPGIVCGSSFSTPSNPINVILIAGQSNANEEPVGSAVGLMTAAGISNPGYSEAPVPGQPFTQWYGSAGFNYFASDGVSTVPPTVAAVTLTQTGGVATFTSAAAALADYSTANKIVIAGADQAGYNGIKRIDSYNLNNQITFAVDAGTVSPATGASITVRRAGFREVFRNDIEALAADGSYINIIGMCWMQGEGNSAASPDISAQMYYMRDFAQATYNWIRGTLCNATRVTVDRDFKFVIGLTGLGSVTFGTAGTYGDDQITYTRNMQKRACDRRPWAHFVETLDLSRPADGVHVASSLLFPRMFAAIVDGENKLQELT